FHGPRALDGTPRFAGLPRMARVGLSNGEVIRMELMADGKKLGLAVSDPFGTLSIPQIQDSLARGLRRGSDQVRESGPGAGLGLFQVWQSVSHLAISLTPGRRTEVVGLIDTTQDYKEFLLAGKSLNL